MNEELLHRTHPEIVKRLRRAEGHLRSTIAMIETGRRCVDLAQQLHAVEKAIAEAKRALIRDLAIIAAIFGIVWQSARAVFTRLLDGVDPHITAELRDAALHVPGIVLIDRTRARWVGHRLYAEAEIQVDADLPVRETALLAQRLRAEAQDHSPALASLRIEIKADRSHAADSEPASRSRR